jgi:hypothetical protein
VAINCIVLSSSRCTDTRYAVCELQGLAALQPRILLWLGRQGGPAAAALAAAAANSSVPGGAAAAGGAAGLVWSDVPLLGIATPFPAEHGGGQVSLEVRFNKLRLQRLSSC